MKQKIGGWLWQIKRKFRNTYHFQALKIQGSFLTDFIFHLWVFQFLGIFESRGWPAPNHGRKSPDHSDNLKISPQLSYPKAQLVRFHVYTRPRGSKMKCFHVAPKYPFPVKIAPSDSCNQHPFARLNTIKRWFSNWILNQCTYAVTANGGTSFAASCFRAHLSTPKAFSFQFSSRASWSLDASNETEHFLCAFELPALGLYSDWGSLVNQWVWRT